MHFSIITIPSSGGLSRVCATPSKIESILLNSTGERGAEIQCQKNIFSSSTSNKIVKKNKSVAELGYKIQRFVKTTRTKSERIGE